jgi:hypothetical protein
MVVDEGGGNLSEKGEDDRLAEAGYYRRDDQPRN